ncbi:hypothetical protein ACIHIX_27540 [Streptomyces sp. NPDC051913]|uniref:hypothetical protein n=1 Tax=Streptomyces sp. NPDC051913 TaxID=3365676 RepID=UPI0037D58667
MNRTPRSIDEALRRARVFEGEYTDADLERSRRTLAGQLHELRWVQFLSTVPAGCAHTPAAALPEQAAHDLRLLCRGTVQHREASGHILAFENDRAPDGALTFASLLYLADEEEGAQFWWHYAAGSGSVTAALCVYLLHLRRGEMRDATHWAGQIHCLNILGWDTYTPVDHHAALPAPPPVSAAAVRYRLPASGPRVCEDALKDALDDLRTPCAGALGPVPQPIPALATHWADLVTC